MGFGGVLAVAVALLAMLIMQVASTLGIDAAAATNAVDFYYVIDGSKSIKDGDIKCNGGKQDGATGACMRLIADFTNKTLTRMVELAGGLYENEDNNGVRVSIVVFKCSGEDTVLLEPTGDRALIDQAVVDLAEVNPGGGTCSSQSLRKVRAFISEGETLGVPRKSSVLYMTDGALGSYFDNKELRKALSETDKMHEPYTNTTAIFGLGVGESFARELNQLTGDPGFVWGVSDPNALQDVIDALVSYIFGDFVIGLASDVVASQVCRGDTPVIEVSGSSVMAIRALECKFTLPGMQTGGDPSIVTTMGAKSSVGTWGCTMPESLYSSPSGENVIVDMFTVEKQSDPGGEDLRRRVGETKTITLGRISCLNVTVVPEGGRCLGAHTTFRLGGPTLEAFGRSSLDYDYQCEFSLTGNGQTFTWTVQGQLDQLTGDAIVCDLPEGSTIFFSASGNVPAEQLQVVGKMVNIYTPYDISDVRVVATVASGGGYSIPGYANEDSIRIESLPAPPSELLLDSEECLTPQVDSAACWRVTEGVSADFSGAVANFAKSATFHNASLKAACLLKLVDDGEPGYLVDAVALDDGSLSCELPSSFFEPRSDGSRGWKMYTDLFIIGGSNKALRLSDFFSIQRTVTFSSCVRISQEGETCFGEEALIELESTQNVAMLPTSKTQVGCLFEDPLNNISVPGELVAKPDGKPNEYQCASPEMNGPYFGMQFQTFELLSNGVAVERVSLTNSTTCFSVFARHAADKPYALLGKGLDGLDAMQCWLDPMPGKSVLFTGKTPLKLKTENATCVFSGGDGVVGFQDDIYSPAIWNEADNGITCEVPDEVFMGRPGKPKAGSELMVSLLVFPGPTAGEGAKPVALFKEAMMIEVDSCFQVDARNGADAPRVPIGSADVEFDIDQCWREPAAGVTLFFLGSTAQKMSTSVVKCVFQGGDGVVDTTADPALNSVVVSQESSLGGFSCDVPAAAFTGLGGESIDEAYTTAPFTVSLEIDGSPLVVETVLRLRSNTASPCLDYTIEHVNKTEHVCMGSAAKMKMSPSGTTYDTLLAQLGNSKIQCSYDKGHANVAGTKEPISCPMPKLSSFSNLSVEQIILNNVVRLLPEPYQKYDDSDCVTDQISVDPQIAADGSRRVLQNTNTEYCLGDGLSTAFSGLTVEFLINTFQASQLMCEWQPYTGLGFVSVNQTATLTSAVVGPSGDMLTCELPIWSPWTAAGLSQGAYVSVQLKVVSPVVNDVVHKPVTFNGEHIAKVCSAGKWSNELNATEADCFRGKISLELSGRSAHALSKRPVGGGVTYDCWGGVSNTAEPLMCEFVSAVDGNITYQLPDFNGTDVTCTAAGWAPDTPTEGNYTKISLAVCLNDGVTTALVKEELFGPTAQRRCLYLAQSQGCPGKPVDFVLGGPTLLSYAEYAQRQGLDIGGAGSSCSTNGKAQPAPPPDADQVSGIKQLVCRLTDTFEPSVKSMPQNLKFNVGPLLVKEEQITIGIIENSRTCINPLGSSSCIKPEPPTEEKQNVTRNGRRLRMHREDMPSFTTASRFLQNGKFKDPDAVALTEVTIEGEVVDYIKQHPNIGLSCEFTNADAFKKQSVTATMQTNNNTGTDELVCTYEGFFSSVTVLYLGKGGNIHPLYVKAPLTQHGTPSLCAVATAIIPAPIQEEGRNAGAIGGAVVAVLILLALVAFFVMRKKKNDENQNGATYEELPDIKADKDTPTSGPAEPLLHTFDVGNRVEAHCDWNPSVSGTGDKAWYKGTVAEDNLNGTFTITLGALDTCMAAGTSVIVPAVDLRVPESDFCVGDIVEARHGGGQMWYAAIVSKVNVNDTYDLTYDDTDSLGEEKLLPGLMIRAPVMVFQPGNLVEVKGSDGRFERATIKAVDITAEQYTVAVANPNLRTTTDPAEEDPDDEVRTTHATYVRAFIPEIGELIDVHVEDCVEDDSFDGIEERATITAVDLENTTATVKYANAEGAAKLSCPTSVPWHSLYRPLFRIGERVNAQEAEKSENIAAQAVMATATANAEGKAWLPGRITGVQSSDNTYTVMYEDKTLGQEAGVVVERLRAVGLYDCDMNNTFSIGQYVEVHVGSSNMSEANASWFEAEITGVNDDGSYNVMFRSGPNTACEEKNVPVKRIRLNDEITLDCVDVQLAESPFANIFRPPPRDHLGASENDGLQVPFHLRFKKRKPLDFTELPNNQFEVKLDMGEGLGLSLGWTKDNRVIVAGFRDLPNGDWGPVEACGLVGLKDQLLKVNLHSIGGKSFVEVSELIKNSGKTIRLQFGRWTDDEAVRPGMGNSNNSVPITA